MKFYSPFKTSAKRDFAKIGSDEEGFVYLLKTGGLSPIENPSEDQAREKAVAELQWTILQAIRRVAKELECSVASARKVLFEAPVRDVEQTPESAGEENGDLVVAVEEERKNADDYLTKEEMFALREMRSTRLDLAKQATTKLMKHRMAYALELKGDITSSTHPFTAPIAPSFFEAEAGRSFSAKGGALILSQALSVGDKVAHFEAITDHPSSKLVDGDALFLLDDETGSELVGCEWTDDMTEAVPYKLLFAIREFYEEEARGVAGPDVSPEGDEPDEESKTAEEQDADLGKQSNDSEPPKAKKRSIGNGSTSGSNGSAVKTAG